MQGRQRPTIAANICGSSYTSIEVAHRILQLQLPPTSRAPLFAVGIQMKELHEPVGWVRVPLYAPVPGGAAAAIAADAAGGTEGPVLRAHFVQICVVAMHQNGRDTHIRQVGIAC